MTAATWVNEWTAGVTPAVASDAVNGALIAVWDEGSGNIWAKQGLLGSAWTEETAAGSVAVAG